MVESIHFVLDESGDWGSTSERFYVIGGYVTKDPVRVRSVMRRLEARIRKRFPEFIGKEIKASKAYPPIKDFILRALASEDIEFCYLVIDKRNSDSHDKDQELSSLKGHELNLFYNYQVGVIATHERRRLSPAEVVAYNFIVDQRSIRTGSQHSLEDYLLINLNLQQGLPTTVKVMYAQSEHRAEVRAADFIANAFWTRENYPRTDNYSILLPETKIRRYIAPDRRFVLTPSVRAKKKRS